MITDGHHPKVDAATSQDQRNSAAYRLWLARLGRRYRAVDPRTLRQAERAAQHYAAANVKARMFLMQRAARIREALKRATRRGLSVVTGGKR